MQSSRYFVMGLFVNSCYEVSDESLTTLQSRTFWYSNGKHLVVEDVVFFYFQRIYIFFYFLLINICKCGAAEQCIVLATLLQPAQRKYSQLTILCYALIAIHVIVLLLFSLYTFCCQNASEFCAHMCLCVCVWINMIKAKLNLTFQNNIGLLVSSKCTLCMGYEWSVRWSGQPNRHTEMHTLTM